MLKQMGMMHMSKKIHKYTRPPKEKPVEIVDKILDENATNRVGEQVPKYIVIHEVSLGTGKSPKKYDMDYYANMIQNFGKTGRTIGYHYLVGDDKVYQFIEDNVATEHCQTPFCSHSSVLLRILFLPRPSCRLSTSVWLQVGSRSSGRASNLSEDAML